MKRKPTGFVALCQCGATVGAMDYERTDRKDAGKLLGEWIAAGCTVSPRFAGTWRATVEACRCDAASAVSHVMPSHPAAEQAAAEGEREFDAHMSQWGPLPPELVSQHRATWQAARRPVRELTDDDINRLWHKQLFTGKHGYERARDFARALLATGEGK